MNYNKQILYFVWIFVSLLLFFSFLAFVFPAQKNLFSKLNILSDVIHPKQDSVINLTKQKIDTSNTISTISANRVFNLHVVPEKITNYYADTNKVCVENFIRKLKELKLKKRKKVRIAYIGDSMIEGDMICQTLRKYLQQNFSGFGVGFVPITSQVAGMRTSVAHSFSNNWIEDNFKSKTHSPSLFISGHSFYNPSESWVSYVDNTDKPAGSMLYKYLVTGINTNNSPIATTVSGLSAKKLCNKIPIDSQPNYAIRISTLNTQIPFYGISLESDSGIIVDNYSFRGSGGLEYAKMDTIFLQAIQQVFQYDLIILQYGVNLLTGPQSNQFNWYFNPMKKSIQTLQAGFKGADFMLISSADKAYRYADGLKTAKGMEELIHLQQKIAFETNIAFYNLYESMGGNGSMVKWVNAKPALAYKDYTHSTPKGSQILAEGIYKAFMKEYMKLK